MKIIHKLVSASLALMMLNVAPAVGMHAAETEETTVGATVTSDYQEAFIDALMNNQNTWSNSQYDCFYFTDLDWDGRLELICDFKTSGSSEPLAEAYGFDGTNIFKYKIGNTSNTKFLDKKGLYFDVRYGNFVWVCRGIDTGANYCYSVPTSHYSQYSHWYDYELTSYQKQIYFDYFAGYCGRDGYFWFDRKGSVDDGFAPGSYGYNVFPGQTKDNYNYHVQSHMKYLYGQDAVHTKYYFSSWSIKNYSAKKQDLHTGYNAFKELNKLRNKEAINELAAQSETPMWKVHYLAQINKFADNKDSGSYRYWLLDFDENGIPELLMDSGYGGFGMYGQTLYTFFNKSRIDTTLGGNWALYRYKNYLYLEGLRRPVNAPWEYYHVAFQINNGNVIRAFSGKAVLNNGQTFTPATPNATKYQYSVYDRAFVDVSSYSQLLNLLGKFVDTNKMTRLNPNEAYTMSQVRNAIQNYGKASSSKPGAPSTSLSNTSSGLNASWNAVSNAASYIVYYKTSSQSNWSSFSTNTTSCYIPNTQSGTLYYVQVQSIGANGVKGDYSNVKSMTYIAQPTITGLSYNGNNTLTWNKINGANKYQIARKKTGDTAYTYFTTTTTSFTEKNISAGITYTYQVRAMYETANNGTAYGAWSGSKSVVTMVNPVLTLSNKSNGIRAEWNAISGAAKYIVYYRRNADSNWSSVTTYNNYYPLLGLTAGTYYAVQVQAVYNNGNGLYSSVNRLTYIPQVNPVLTLSNKSNGIRAEWDKIPGATKYIVYYRRNADSKWSSVTTSNNYYPLLNLTAGTQYAVQVQAVFGSANGLYSSVNRLTYIPQIQTNVSLSNKSNGIRAEWDQVPGATDYIVYYKPSGAAWSSITTKNNYFAYLNTKSGTLYCVQVQPVFNGSKGLYSKVKSMTFIAQPSLSATKQSNNVKLSWNSIPGANKYQIATKKTSESNYRYITVTGTFYIDTAAKSGENEYQVRAMYATSNNGTAYGYWSNIAYVTK